MTTQAKTIITVESVINAPLATIWECWTAPEHIKQWNNASDDWFTPHVVNDLRTGGSFNSRMEAKDGSMGFDFAGVYDEVRPEEYIAYTLGDGRIVNITFTGNGNTTKVEERFEAEDMHSVAMQQAGWQAILDNFKKYAESK